MESDIKAKAPLRQRVIGELEELLVLTVYLFIVIWAMNVMKAAVLHSHGIEVAFWGVAIVKALLLAKFVMLGRALKLGGTTLIARSSGRCCARHSPSWCC